MARKSGSSSTKLLIFFALVLAAVGLLFLYKNDKLSFLPKRPSTPPTSGIPTYNEKISADRLKRITLNDGPWDHSVYVTTSADGNSFSKGTVFQLGADSASVTQGKNGKLYAVFQWYTKDNADTFDRIAVKTSVDNGTTWSNPQVITINNFPATYERPLTGALTALPDGKLRLYMITRSHTGGMPGVYSAISEDGVTYTFEDGARLVNKTEYTISPAVAALNNKWHMVGQKTTSINTAYHATSSDGLTFTPQKDIETQDGGNWVGSLVNYSDGLRFYGKSLYDDRLFWSFSTDGTEWTQPTFMELTGNNPSVTKVNNSKYLLLYTEATTSPSAPIITTPTPAAKSK